MLAEIRGQRIRAGEELLPLSMDSCYRLRERFGDRLVIGPLLLDWARNEVKRPVPAEITRWSPVLAEAVQRRPYQITGAQAIASISNIGVFDEPGLGKTAQALAGLMVSGNWEGRHLVICPKTAVVPTWAEQIRQWTDGKVFVALEFTPKKRAVIQEMLAAEGGARFLLTNPESLRTRMEKFCPKCDRWLEQEPRVIPQQHVGQDHKTPWKIYRQPIPELFGVEWDSVIADECDRYMLPVRPQTGKMTLAAEGLVRLQARQRIAMTGTPFRGKEKSIFGILHWLEPRQHKAYWDFIKHYFVQEDNGFGIEIGGLLPGREEAFGELLDRHTIRRTRAEVRNDLPDNLHITHWVEMPTDHRAQYQTFERDGFIRLGQDVLHGQGVLSELTRLKQMAFGAFDLTATRLVPRTSPKFELLVDMLAERGVNERGDQFGDMKYIVASQFTGHLDWLAEKLARLRIDTLRITGKVTGQARTEAVKSFQSSGGPRVLLLNTQVASSITLDAWCDEMFILDETFVEDDQVQLRGRIDNRGDRVAVRVFHYFRTRGTIDERIALDNLSQAEMQDQLLDGRRGIEVAKRLLGRTT